MASAFEIYLRTGRRVKEGAAAPEFKFNPWHDPDDGRFTFAGQGRYYPGRHGDVGTEGGARTGGRGAMAAHGRNDPKDPSNHSIYTVKRGDSLTRIARQRKGLTAADLAWLNELTAYQALQIGQKLKLPHQQFLDRGRRARDNFLALAYYIDATGGKLPPNVAQPPSIATQVEASGIRELHRNGYSFDADVLRRTRRVSGELTLKSELRSRRLQGNAGRPDRRITDDGGHYIAARFRGPREWFNHFAQDANFNRGAYRAIEDDWARAVQSGKRVFVDIVPRYRGTSMRPHLLVVTWTIDGKKSKRRFANERGGH